MAVDDDLISFRRTNDPHCHIVTVVRARTGTDEIVRERAKASRKRLKMDWVVKIKERRKKTNNSVCNVDVVAADEQNRFKVKCLRLSSRTTKPFTTSLFDLMLLQNFSHYYLHSNSHSHIQALDAHKKKHIHIVYVQHVYIYFERLALWFDVCAWSWCKCGKCMQHAYSTKCIINDARC